MYRKRSQSWLKHSDFMIIDLLAINLAVYIAYLLRFGILNPSSSRLYKNSVIVISLLNIAVSVFFESYSGVLNRGYYKEFVETGKHIIFVLLFFVVYLYVIKESVFYSRMILAYICLLDLFLSYLFRLLWKHFLKQRMTKRGKRSLLIITSQSNATECIKSIQRNNYQGYQVVGISVIDNESSGSVIQGVPVVANLNDIVDYICSEWVDEVLIDLSHDTIMPESIMLQIQQIGVVIHERIAKESNLVGRKQFTEKIGEYTVLTTTMNFASTMQLFIKRCMDVLGGIVGCIITCILYLFLAPVIKSKSPGPVFFSQERVGRNGKRFKIYKFRSMYLDAEQRKAELMEKNVESENYMFKLDEDPRIIGSSILSDGTYKKGIGNFIREYSLDEFPQFWNVLKGDMSIVGTRPPLVNEVNMYEPHHHARLAAKPGITGMWQVNGRSRITDFEEVVRLDTEYINTWNIGLDLKILLKTVSAVTLRNGSM